MTVGTDRGADRAQESMVVGFQSTSVPEVFSFFSLLAQTVVVI